VRTAPPSTAPSVPSSAPPPAGGQRFAVIGEQCQNRGEFAFTERYEPVVCRGQRSDQKLVWRRAFR
jgi:hypothetical protein